MADTQTILDAHNRLCLTVSSALGSVGDLSQLLTLKSEVEGMRQSLNEVCHSILIIFCTSGINCSWD